MRNRLQLISYASFFMIALLSCAASANQDFVYQNCADQGFGVALEHCATIKIEKSLASVSIRDMNLQSDGGTSQDGYRYLNSPDISIALPIKGYDQLESWEFKDKLFKKILKNKKYFINKANLDMVVVLPSQGRRSEQGLSREYIDASLLLSFLYSPEAGVVAIAFPSKNLNADAFFCASPLCLFQTTKATE